MRPLCFVVMPFGLKPDGAGGTIDFDAVYSQLLKPAIERAGLEPIRADEEQQGGFIHKPMYERLILAEYALVDLTTANSNVFYELGVRHAIKRHTTISVFAGGGRLPFDVAPLRAFPYQLANGKPVDAESTAAKIAELLIAARNPSTDSPIFQLVEGFPDIQHLKTDVFRDRVAYNQNLQRELADARKRKPAAEALQSLRGIEAKLDPAATDFGVLVDLMLSYRAVKGFTEMIALVGRMPAELKRSVLVREQLAFAHNRKGESQKAEQILIDLIAERGPSSETYGLLGRVYKDQWEAASKAGDQFEAEGLLDKAIDAYLKGFETDWRDFYPGINAVTLMEIKGDGRRQAIVPVVRYAVERSLAKSTPDYWGYATLLEVAVLGKDEAGARAALGKALAVVRESWEPETTLRNLRLIREVRQSRGETVAWQEPLEAALNKKSLSFS